MSAPLTLPAPSCPDLLHTAYALGRVDGLLAADFARQLWDLPDGEPPAGLEVDAPHWYARGFEEALSDARAASGGHRAPALLGAHVGHTSW